MTACADHWWYVQRHPSGASFCVRHTSRGPHSFTVDKIGVSQDMLGGNGIPRYEAEHIANALNEAYALGVQHMGDAILSLTKDAHVPPF